MSKLGHVLSTRQFSRQWLEQELFPLAHKMETVAKTGGCRSLSGKCIFVVFWEPSTRTFVSFLTAARKLGVEVGFSSQDFAKSSSTFKGESLEDTIRVFNCYYPDVIVMRHNETGAVNRASQVSSVPIINAGDGKGEHPTQALLDVYTLWRKFGKIDYLNIALVGDLLNGRTVHSLAWLLAEFKVKIYLVSPDNLKMPEEIKGFLRSKNVLRIETDKLENVIGGVDVVYQTRTQTERGSLFDGFIIDNSVADQMKQSAVIMHPLPRGKEIAAEVDSNHRAIYFTEQVPSGLFVRMALLKMILG